MSRHPAREPWLRTGGTEESTRLTSRRNGQIAASTNMPRGVRPHNYPNCSVQKPYSPPSSGFVSITAKAQSPASILPHPSNLVGAFQVGTVCSEVPHFSSTGGMRRHNYPLSCVSGRRIGHEGSCVFQIHQMNFMDDDVCWERIGLDPRRRGCRPAVKYQFHGLRSSFRLRLRRLAARPEIRKSLSPRLPADRSRTDGWRVRARCAVPPQYAPRSIPRFPAAPTGRPWL